jgi:crotonobetainyl-CoA:carnitine CoA-transferase CaiB-like acyl-CoA transferase
MRAYRGEELTMSQPVFHMDPVSGVGAAFAVLCALRVRKETGRGQFIDFSQAENLIHQGGEFVLEAVMNDRSPRPIGNRNRWGAVQGCYPCAEDDSWVVITIEDDDDWARLCAMMGDPPWTADDCFATVVDRLKNHDELDARIGEWTALRTAEETMHLLQAHGIAAATVMNERDAFNDKHLRERGFFLRLTQRDSGTHLYPGHLWRFSRTPLQVRYPAPNFGQDNEYIYRTVLGFSDEEYERFVREQHIGDEFLEGVGVGRRPA